MAITISIFLRQRNLTTCLRFSSLLRPWIWNHDYLRRNRDTAVHIKCHLCLHRLWSLWKPRIWRIQQCCVNALSNNLDGFYFYISAYNAPSQADSLSTALLHYWCFSTDPFCFCVSGFSQKKTQATEMLLLDTTWKRRWSDIEVFLWL